MLSIYETDNENLSRLVTRSSWFRGLDFLEELVENIDERVIIGGTEHLRDKNTSLGQKFDSQTQGMENQRVLYDQLDL